MWDYKFEFCILNHMTQQKENDIFDRKVQHSPVLETYFLFSFNSFFQIHSGSPLLMQISFSPV